MLFLIQHIFSQVLYENSLERDKTKLKQFKDESEVTKINLCHLGKGKTFRIQLGNESNS